MTSLDYRLIGPIGSRATLGLIVLQTDEVIEQDFRRLFPQGDIALHASRIPSDASVTAETLAAMEAALPASAGLFPPAVMFDAIGYGCTSGATVIGPDRVAALVGGAAQTRAVCNPLSATIAAMRALDVRRLALISPYVADVSAALREALAGAGFEIAVYASFDEREDARVARIDPESLRAAALQVGARADVDTVFMSCTNLRTLDILADLEAALGKPVLSSNQALGWHMARQAGLPAPDARFGRLMTV